MPGPIDYSLINLQPDHDSAGWWEGTAAHRLLVRSCEDCAHRWFPPGPVCPSCRSMNPGWHEAEGRGVIASYVVVCHPVLAAFREAVPYVVALVELPDCANANGEPVRIGGVLVDDEDCRGHRRPRRGGLRSRARGRLRRAALARQRRGGGWLALRELRRQ